MESNRAASTDSANDKTISAIDQVPIEIWMHINTFLDGEAFCEIMKANNYHRAIAKLSQRCWHGKLIGTCECNSESADIHGEQLNSDDREPSDGSIYNRTIETRATQISNDESISDGDQSGDEENMSEMSENSTGGNIDTKRSPEEVLKPVMCPRQR